MAYSKKEILFELAKTKDKDLYNLACVNYKGCTKKGEKYTEIIAGNILENGLSIKPEKERKCYKNDLVRDAKVIAKKDKYDERKIETLLAWKNAEIKLGDLGKIINYQVPVSSGGCGKIDLISLTKDSLYLIELKAIKSAETLLRCILEIQTYFDQISKEKLLNSYAASGKKVKKAILIFKDTQPYYEYKDIKNKANKKLIEKLKVDIFILKQPNTTKIEKLKFEIIEQKIW